MIGFFCVFFFQAEDGIRDLVRSRGLGDVYKRQVELDEQLWIGGDLDDIARYALEAPEEAALNLRLFLSLIHI